MKTFELTSRTINGDTIARVHVKAHHLFYTQNKKWDAVVAIFKQLGIELASHQEDLINKEFYTKHKAMAVVDKKGNWYSLFILNNIMVIKPRITEYVVCEKQEVGD